ncbi:uncharacterized protein [Watersipora subatra]|uniref:uncharacterized protein n=1 Tax=Watersipora subatra TaxID=2589382 RepID=UPI00355C6A5E
MLKEETEDELTMFDGALLLGSIGPNKKQKRRKKFKTFALCGACFGVGLALAIPGPTLNYLRCQVGATIQTISYIFPARSLGYLVGSAAGGFLFDKLEKQVNALVSLALILAGLTIALAPWTTSLLALCVLLFVTSAFLSLLDTDGNMLLHRKLEQDSGPYLQLLHVAFGLGACIAPLVAAPLLSSTELSCNTTIQISNYTTTAAIAVEPMHKRHYPKPNAPALSSNSSSNMSFFNSLESLNSSSSSRTPLSTSTTFLTTLPLVYPKPNTGEAIYDETSFNSSSSSKTPLSTSMTFLTTLPLVYPKPNTGEATSDETSFNSSSSSRTPLSTSTTFLTTLPLVYPKPNTGEATSDETSFNSANSNNLGEKLDEAEKNNKPSKVTIQSSTSPKTELTGNTTPIKTSVAISFDTSSAKSDNTTYNGTTDVTGLVTWVSNGSIVAGAENDTATNIYESNMTAPSINASTTSSGVDLTAANSSLRATASQSSVLTSTEGIAVRTTKTTAAPSTATAPEVLLNSAVLTNTITANTSLTTSTAITSPLPAKLATTISHATTTNASTATKMASQLSFTSKKISIETSSHISVATTLKPLIVSTKETEFLDKLASNTDQAHRNSTTTDLTTQSVDISSTKLVNKPNINSVGDGDGRSVYEKGKELLMSISKVQFSYLFIALVLFLFGFMFCCLSDRTDSVSKRRKLQNDLEEVADLMMGPPLSYRIKVMSAASIFFFMYVGAEVSYGQFIATFSIHHNGFTESTAAYLTAIYWGMFALARGLSMPISKCLSPTAMLTISLFITLCSAIGLTIATVTINSTSALWVFSGGIGFGMATISPTGVQWLHGYIKVTGKIAAVLVCASALGAMVVPTAVGFFIESMGPMTVIYTCSSCMLICALTFSVMHCVADSNSFRYEQVDAYDTHNIGNTIRKRERKLTDSNDEMSDKE